MAAYRTQKRPRLMLIGAAGALAGAGLIAGCHDQTPVQVERAGYASQADCERDWQRPDDCTLIAGGGQPASGSSGSSGSGGAHGGFVGAHWYPPNRFLPLKVRALIDYLVEHLEPSDANPSRTPVPWRRPARHA